MTSQQGKGAVPGDHYLSTGVNYAQLGPALRVVPESDVVLAVGNRLLINGLALKPFQKLVRIDVDPDQLHKNHPADVGIEGDARLALAALNRVLKEVSNPKESRRSEVEGYKRAFEDELRTLAPEQTAMVDAIRAELDDDAVLVSGMTNVGYWCHLAYPARQPRTYVTTSYFGTLGYAFPTSLGAKLAMPDRQVVSLNGDGGFLFNSQELSTAAAYGIKVVALVFNNGAYGASRWDQAHRFGGRYIGTELHNPDFMKLAEAYGVVGMRTDPSGLGTALRRALKVDAPVLLEVAVPDMMPPFHVVR
jgi:acetolactate synthase-1/2/3 large subunit